MLVVLLSFGLDAARRISETAFVVLKWVGAAYLLYLAWQLWTADTEGEIAVPDLRTLMRREFLTLTGKTKADLLLTG